MTITIFNRKEDNVFFFLFFFLFFIVVFLLLLWGKCYVQERAKELTKFTMSSINDRVYVTLIVHICNTLSYKHTNHIHSYIHTKYLFKLYMWPPYVWLVIKHFSSCVWQNEMELLFLILFFSSSSSLVLSPFLFNS